MSTVVAVSEATQPPLAESLRPAAASLGLARENSIGFLRLLFAVFVIYGHAYFLSKAGPDPLASWTQGTAHFGLLGVQSFFVLSGYLVASSYQRSTSVFRYLWSRFLRLAPALWACLLVTAFVLAPILFFTSAPSGTFFGQEPGPVGYVLTNFASPRGQITIGQLLATNPYPGEINGSLWTLFYEAACYGLVAAFGLVGLLTRWRRWGLLALLGLLALYLVWQLRPGLLPGWLFNTEGKRLVPCFVAGMVWAVLPTDGLSWLRHGATAIAATLVLLAGYHWQLHLAVAPIALAPIIFWLAEHLPFRNYERRLGGDYSYGLYVYGYPLQQTLAHFGVHQAGVLVYGLSAFLLALGLGFLSWRLVEAPALRLKSLGLPPRTA